MIARENNVWCGRCVTRLGVHRSHRYMVAAAFTRQVKCCYTSLPAHTPQMAGSPPPLTLSRYRVTASQQVLNEIPALQRANDQLVESSNLQIVNVYGWRLTREKSMLSKSLEYVSLTLMSLSAISRLASASYSENSVRMQSQLDMKTIFLCEGRRGLQKKIYDLAQDQNLLNFMSSRSLDDNSSWNKLLRDKRTENNYSHHLLMTCKDQFLLSMIRGTLASNIDVSQTRPRYWCGSSLTPPVRATKRVAPAHTPLGALVIC